MNYSFLKLRFKKSMQIKNKIENQYRNSSQSYKSKTPENNKSKFLTNLKVNPLWNENSLNSV